MHAFDYFQQIYVINLASRQDRRREMAEQLAGFGLGFDSPNIRLFEAIRPDVPCGFPTIGARGCFLSHLGVLRDACERRYERILILEDDLNFTSDFSARVGALEEALERLDWSVFYGGYTMKTAPQPEIGEIVVRAKPSDSIQTAHFIGFRGPAIAEIASFLELLLSRPAGDPRGGPMHVDGAYCWFRNEFPSRTTLLAVPHLGYQRSSMTDIHPLRWFDRVPGARPTMGWLRTLKNSARR